MGADGRVCAGQRATRIAANGRERFGLGANCYQNCYRLQGGVCACSHYIGARRTEAEHRSSLESRDGRRRRLVTCEGADV